MPILYEKAKNRYKTIPESWWSTGPAGSSPLVNNFYSNLGDELTPKLPLIDVVNDFPWTLTPTKSEARKEAPYIILTEWLQLETQLNQCLLPYGRDKYFANFTTKEQPSFLDSIGGFVGTLGEILEGITLEQNQIYKGLFDHIISTDFIYRLPFFTPEHFKIQNNWSATDVLDTIVKLQSQGLGLGRGIFKALASKIKQGSDEEKQTDDVLLSLPSIIRQFEIFNLQSRSPAVGLMDPPQLWKSTNHRQYSFSFPLYNISFDNKTKTITEILKNWEFCFLITYQNLINKGNFYTAIPPVFYQVEIPGIHYCKASYMSNINIQNIGNTRLLKLPINNAPENTPVIVPDGYLITITLTDLLMPSKNLLNAVTNRQYRQNIQKTEI